MRYFIVVSIVMATLLLSACGSTTPPPDVEVTIVAAVAATIAAQPTNPPPIEVVEPEPLPTYTIYPTYTPYPTLVVIEPTVEATSEPTVEATSEPTVEATSEPTVEATSEPTVEATSEPTVEVASVSAVEADPVQPVDTAIRPKDKAAMVFVPAGEFLMGASAADLSTVGAGGPPKLAGGDEQPQYTVDLPAFWIDQTEVTNAQFSDFSNLTGYQTTAQLEGYGTSRGVQIEGATFFHPRGTDTGIDDKQTHPVVQVSWADAKTYCEWVGARLPTETEWEKTAKGVNNDRVFPWGNAFQLPAFDVSTVTNFCDSGCPYEEGKDPNVNDSYSYTAPVGSFPAGASPYGALDMAGNVWEWVDGFYTGYPGTTYEQAGDFGETYRVVRGGSWDNAAQHIRATFRQNNEPLNRSDGTGFRCAVSADVFEPAVTAEPTAETTAEPTAEITAEPTAETTAEPTAEITAEPTAEPTTEAGSGG